MPLSSSQSVVAVNNDKTGYSLTAGSYSVRASSTQRVQPDLNGVASANSSISAVTTTRATLSHLGVKADTSVASGDQAGATVALSSTTNVQTLRAGSTATAFLVGTDVLELF